MRPTIDIPKGRLPKECGQTTHGSSFARNAGPPTSFRLATGEEIENSSKLVSGTCTDSNYGVKSLQDSSTFGGNSQETSNDAEEDDCLGQRRSTTIGLTERQSYDIFKEHREQDKASNGAMSSPQPGSDRHSPPSMSQSIVSLASISLDSQAHLSSSPSSPKSTSNRSFNPSDEEFIDEGASQAIVSSEDDEIEPRPIITDSIPQLVMPSIRLPSRRPFTERGRGMGRLKVLIAGDSGVGKTSLIKSIVQTCEDIVHVDPLSPMMPSIIQPSTSNSKIKQDSFSVKATKNITEVYASTKSYPPWWSDIEDSKVLRRRKSMGDTVLERNLCFVDTPGYSNGISRMERMQSILEYIELQLTKPFSAPTATEGDIAGLLSGSGGSQVDLVLYLITQDLKDEDMIFLQRLTTITNVVPLIAKSDTMSLEEIEMLRRSIDRLRHTEIKLFSFNTENAPARFSYTVCSTPSDDDDNMDASILMSPDYVQPLVSSDLATLIQHVFDPDNIACLRYLAAKKLVHSRSSKLFSIAPNSAPTRPAIFPRSNTGQTIVPYISSYKQAKIADHTQQEEKLAQIRLAKWASDLQRSLQNERAKYEAIARGERAVWLTEKLSEYHDNANLALTSSTLTRPDGKGQVSAKPDMLRVSRHNGLLDSGDPLGLLRWNEAMKRRGWIAFQIMGTFGVVGVVAFWMAKGWGASESYTAWTWEWLGGRA